MSDSRVHMLGHIDDNLHSGLSACIQWHELDAALASGAALIDVRTASEFAKGSIEGALNIPVDELRDRLEEVPAGPVVVHCAVGLRGHVAARILRQRGWEDVRNLSGGYTTWRAGTS